jgi:hypothetical protein
MDLAALRNVVLGVNFSTHGVPAQVTRPAPDDTVIATTVIWLTTGSEQLPNGAGFGRVGPTHQMAIRLDEVPTVPIGTLIQAAPPTGGSALGWKVDGIDAVFADHVRAFVVRASGYDA